MIYFSGTGIRDSMTEIRLPEARDLFSRELTFPVACSTVEDELGEVVLASPAGSPETIREVLERCETREFASADELYSALLTSVGEQYIGRKGYDDRGSTPGYDDEVSL
jgi:hypothetical protein